ncbi:MAG: FAD-binding oxidoreductase [Moorellales bacterium]
MTEWVKELERRLGKERIFTSPVVRQCYGRDFAPTEPSYLPQAVVMVRDEPEVVAVLELAHRKRVPVVPRGAGTGVAGGAVAIRGGMVLDLSLMNRVLRVDPEEFLVVVQPGVVWAELNRSLAAHSLLAPSVPGSGRVSTVGGTVAAGGSGMRSLRYGTIREQVLGLAVVLPGGKTLRVGGKTFKSACGYSLKDLLVGSEGTLGVITEITLRVWPRPPATLLVEAAAARLEEVPAVFRRLRQAGVLPSAFELIPSGSLVTVGERPKAGEAWLMVEFQGSEAEIEAAEVLARTLLPDSEICFWRSEPEQARRWQWYSEVYYRLVRLRPALWAEDLGVPLAAVPGLLKEAENRARELGVSAGFVSHAGDGTIHCVISVDPSDPEEMERARRLREELYRRVLELGGTITAEHGVGARRSSFGRLQLGPALELMRQIKAVFDPHGIMNPGKLGLED